MWNSIANRFRWPSLIVMVISLLLFILLNGLRQGGSYAGSRGVPFAWSWWRDTGPPFDGYSIFGFLADVAVALACVVSIGRITAWILHPRFRRLTAIVLFITIFPIGWLIFSSRIPDGLGYRGLPFSWEHWDPNSTMHGYNWFALISDSLLYFLGQCGIVWIVEAFVKGRVQIKNYENTHRKPVV